MSELNTFSLNDSYETFACIFTEVLHGEDYHKMIAKAQAQAAEKVRQEMEQVLAQERLAAEKARQEAAKNLIQERLAAQSTLDKERSQALQKERLAAQKAEKALQKERLVTQKAEKALQQERLEAEKAFTAIQERNKMILKLYHLKAWSVEQIAEVMELDPLFIQQLVDKHPLA
jgi:DNA-directed RNA polymerase specialized sigma subunit